MADKKKEVEIIDEDLIDEDDIFVLHNEATDKDEEFVRLATLTVDDKWYIVLEPNEEVPDIEEGEVLIYEIVEADNGEDMLAPIEDEKELEKVFQEFLNLVDEEGAAD